MSWLAFAVVANEVKDLAQETTRATEEIVTKVNSKLANFETMKRCRVVAEEWTLETGELTPSRKLKRRVITSRYAETIADLYADEATSHGA